MLAVSTSVIGIIILWFACAHHDPPVFALEDVTDELMGKVVTLNGTLESVKVYDTVVIANFVGSEIILFGFTSNMPAIGVGDFVIVTGEITEYKGDLEIVPNKLEDVKIVKAAPRVPKTVVPVKNVTQKTIVTQPEEHEPQIVDLKKVTTELLGEIITVQGVLKKVNVYGTVVIGEFRGSDLKLFGFANSMPELKEFDLVTVTGEVKEYKGELEIVVKRAEDVVLES